MKDWKAIATASNLEIPSADLDRAAGPLNTLESAFRPLVKDLRYDLEPAVVFDAGEAE